MAAPRRSALEYFMLRETRSFHSTRVFGEAEVKEQFSTELEKILPLAFSSLIHVILQITVFDLTL